MGPVEDDFHQGKGLDDRQQGCSVSWIPTGHRQSACWTLLPPRPVSQSWVFNLASFQGTAVHGHKCFKKILPSHNQSICPVAQPGDPVTLSKDHHPGVQLQ